MRFRHATTVASGESFLCVVEAPSEELVRQIYARASVPFERISGALTEQHRGGMTTSKRKENDRVRNLKTVIPSLAASAVAAMVLAGTALGAGPRTLAQAQAAGWDCNPLILIGGHYHCSPPGVPAVHDIVDGTAMTPSIVHQVFRPDGSFAGTETLIRADLYAGQPCPTDQWLPVPPWLPSPTYYACHHFDFTP